MPSDLDNYLQSVVSHPSMSGPQSLNLIERLLHARGYEVFDLAHVSDLTWDLLVRKVGPEGGSDCYSDGS